uniref:Uncharacterized protein n=1 Tax=Panagrolaimus sp. PS1159 TaxID=55785 RepID=A0AC35GRC8_9BILA
MASTSPQVSQPHNIEWNGDKNALYTLVKTDPDAPSRANMLVLDHQKELVFIVTLILFINNLEKFLILNKHGHLTNDCADNRGGWSVDKFAQKLNLGTHVAGNFFQAEYDDYVPDLYKKLGFEA